MISTNNTQREQVGKTPWFKILLVCAAVVGASAATVATAKAHHNSIARQLGVPCEEMCKRMGVYPNCQCPGFESTPVSDDDDRACYSKYCQDPKAPCPNDAFVTCVKESTKVSV